MKNKETYKCPFCGQGSMVTTTMDYEIVDTLNRKTVIPNIEVDTCDACGEKFFGYEAAVRLEEIKKKGNRVTLYLNSELQKRIKNLAEKHKRSFEEEVNYLLETTLT
jgi:YgiT-type zinc finger domain-containing protein